MTWEQRELFFFKSYYKVYMSYEIKMNRSTFEILLLDGGL